MPRARLVRVAAMTTPTLRLRIDGREVAAQQGETVLTAMLAHVDHLRRAEANGEPRAGFCLMGACQDCWVWFGDRPRGRACTTLVTEGLEVFTEPPPGLLP